MTTARRMRQGMRYGAVLVAAGALAGCATAPSTKPLPSMHTAPVGSQVLWHNGVQYVALSKPASSGAAPSDQPVTLKASQLGKALGKLKVQWGQEPGAHAVFTEASLKRLTPHLSQALSQAGPHQDVTFAVITRGPLRHGKMVGIQVSHPTVTTVRAFYRQDHLNLIFGLVHARFVEEYMNTGHLRPMPPGQRDGELQGDYRIEGSGAAHPHSGRPDWVSVALMPPQPKPQPKPQPQAQSQPQTQPQTQPKASVSKGSVNQAYQSIARRLKILDKLRRQGLITKQEYQSKRAEILKGL